MSFSTSAPSTRASAALRTMFTLVAYQTTGNRLQGTGNREQKRQIRFRFLLLAILVPPRGSSFANLRLILLWSESIPHPGLGEDVARRVGGLDFFSQLINKHAEILRLLNALWAPYGFEQYGVRQNFFRM